MPLTNAEKQARWRDRNVIVLTRDAREIAGQLIDQITDRDGLQDIVKTLRKVASFIDDHLRRTPRQRQVRRHR
jgi:hypothetical protein